MEKQTIAKPNISGKLINLRPVVKADAQAMFNALADKEGRRLTGTKKIFTFKKVEAFCAGLLNSNNRIDYAISLKDNSAYIGEVVLNNINFEDCIADFRIALSAQQYYNKGYGTEATKLMLKHGFETLQLHRIELEVYDFNHRARHVYEKVGFVKEGIRKDALLWEGVYHNAILMRMLKDDWFARYG